MTLPSAVLVLTASLLTIPVAARQFPHPEEESLAGQKVVLPELVSGKVAVLVLGFSKASSTPTGAWAKRAHRRSWEEPRFRAVPAGRHRRGSELIRGMIISGMKKGMPDPQRAYVVPVVHQERELKAYVVVLDRNSSIMYQTHAATADPGYAELRANLRALLK